MKRILLLAGFLLLVLTITSQVKIDYKPGYVVLINNDTVYGTLKTVPFPSLYTKVQFKGNKDVVDKTYSTDKVKSFHFEPGTTFEALVIRSMNQKDSTELTCFALRKLTGTVDLFIVYQPNGEERFFVRNSDYGLSELKQPIETIQNQVFANKQYLSVLTKYLGNVPEFKVKVMQCSYYEGSFEKLISQYNAHFGGSFTPELNHSMSCDWSLSGGLDYYLRNQIDDGLNVYGVELALEASFSNKEKNLKSEFVVGLSYRSFYSDQYMTSRLRYDTVNVSSPIGHNSYILYLYDEKVRVIQSGYIIGLPMYFRYNDRTKLISPLLEGGVEPYVIQNRYDAGSFGSFQSKFELGLRYIIGLGVGLNQERYRMKYMLYADPLLLNAVSIQFNL